MKRNYLLALAFLLPCCDLSDEDKSSIQIKLFTLGGQDNLLKGEGPNEIEFIRYDMERGTAGLPPIYAAIEDGSTNNLEFEFDNRYRIFVRGLKGSSLHFYGSSTEFLVEHDKEITVPIQVGKVNCLGLSQGPTSLLTDGTSYDMLAERTEMAVTPLKDGRVLITGGGKVDQLGKLESIHQSIEIFDPANYQFSYLNYLSLDVPRMGHTATLLNNGYILVYGGQTTQNGEVQPAEGAFLIKPDLSSIITLADPPAGRYDHQATLLHDGSVLIAGGYDSNGCLVPSTYRFFPDKSGHGGKFIEQAPMKYPRAHFTLIPYPTGSNMAIAIGGVTQDGDECKNVPAVLAAESELFTVLETQKGAKCKEDGALPTEEVGCFMSSDTFLSIAKLKEPRSHHAFVPVDDGKRFLILGGFSDIDEKQSAETIEFLDNNYQLQEVGTLKDAFGDLSAIKLLDGSVLVLGGRNTNEPSKLTSNLSARLEPKFDSEHKLIGLTQSLLQKGCELSLGRYNHKLVELPQRSVLVVGGVTQTNQGLSAAKMGEFYIPKFTLMSDAYPD